MLQAELIIALMFFVLVLGVFTLILVFQPDRLLRLQVKVRRLWNLDVMKNVRPVLKSALWMAVAGTFSLTVYNWFINWRRMR